MDLDKIKQALIEKGADWNQRSERRIYAKIDKTKLIDVADFLFNKAGARFATASGVDCRKHMEIVYHFALDKVATVLSVMARIDKESLEIESLTQLFKAADWVEREMHELLGIKFLNHPDLSHLLLDDDWPEGNYPLRRYTEDTD